MSQPVAQMVFAKLGEGRTSRKFMFRSSAKRESSCSGSFTYVIICDFNLLCVHVMIFSCQNT